MQGFPHREQFPEQKFTRNHFPTPPGSDGLHIDLLVWAQVWCAEGGGWLTPGRSRSSSGQGRNSLRHLSRPWLKPLQKAQISIQQSNLDANKSRIPTVWGLCLDLWGEKGRKGEGWGDVNFVSGAMIRNVSGRHLNGKANCWRQAIWWIETKISERW